ncbi:MAG: branched-chain amino acid ABC transporter permease [Desulfobacterales bacterium]|nr:branched-chain amino acid ABC transporter permease [Desulfobacterales bacterium]
MKKDYIGILVLICCVSLVPFFIQNNYYIGVFVFTGINCLACIGLSLLMGYAGQISLGHAAFIGIGAYSSAILTVTYHWFPWFAILAGVVFSVITALCIGIPALRLKGHYLAMATMGFGSIMHIVAVAAIDITAGPSGISGIPKLSLFGFELNTDVQFFYFIWFVVILGLYLAINIIHSREGRALRSLHGSEDAARAMGIHTSMYKIKIFLFSAVYASLAGSFYAHYVNYIDPDPFGVMHSVLLLTMVAVGGIHQLWGAVIGAILLSLLPEFLSSLTEFFDSFNITYQTDYDTIIYGSILLLIMLFMPEGLVKGISTFYKYTIGRYLIPKHETK